MAAKKLYEEEEDCESSLVYDVGNKKKRRKKRRLTGVSRLRRAANERERLRVNGVNDAISTLRDIIPVDKGEDVSRIETLRLASKWIAHLTKVLIDDDQEKGCSENSLSETLKMKLDKISIELENFVIVRTDDIMDKQVLSTVSDNVPSCHSSFKKHVNSNSECIMNVTNSINVSTNRINSCLESNLKESKCALSWNNTEKIDRKRKGMTPTNILSHTMNSPIPDIDPSSENKCPQHKYMNNMYFPNCTNEGFGHDLIRTQINDLKTDFKDKTDIKTMCKFDDKQLPVRSRLESDITTCDFGVNDCDIFNDYLEDFADIDLSAAKSFLSELDCDIFIDNYEHYQSNLVHLPSFSQTFHQKQSHNDYFTRFNSSFIQSV